MAARRFDFSAASAAKQDIVIVLSGGREFTFPGDVEADAWLSFLEKWADLLEGEVLPFRVIEPMYRMLLGDGRFEELRKELTWGELVNIATTLWKEYSGVTPDETTPKEEGDTRPT